MQAVAYKDTTSASSRGAVKDERYVVDPRRRKFGYNPGIFPMEMPPREAGQAKPILPVGLITFRTDRLVDENYEDVLRVPEGEFKKQILKEFPASWFLNNTLIRYQSMGFRELTSLTLIDDPTPNEKGNITKEQAAKSAQGVYAGVHPSFEEIGHVCPEGLDECGSCRKTLLGTEKTCPEYLQGRIGSLPDPQAGEALRRELIAANQAWLSSCAARWAELVGEVKKRANGEPGISFIEQSSHYIRKHLHEVEPSEAATAASFGIQVGTSQAEGFKQLAEALQNAKGGDNSELLKMLAENQQRQDRILEELLKANKKTAKAETV